MKNKSKPILFSTEMVQAILAGRKTMTRRVLKSRIALDKEFKFEKVLENKNKSIGTHAFFSNSDFTGTIKCPYGNVGDELWVKESYYAFGHWQNDGLSKTGKQKWKFEELTTPKCQYDKFPGMDVKTGRDESEFGWFKRPSLFMSKRHSRITLVITDIRVERLQDISEGDAKSEGIKYEIFNDNRWYFDYVAKEYSICFPCISFRSLWASINGEESWDLNPWVWVVEFKRKEVGDA